jgi:uncharacterized LabA/DUF88 family protein
MKRLAVFVDVSNIYYCVGKRFNGRKLDYAKYIEYVRGLGDIHEAIAYGAQIGDEARGFIHCLKQLDFTTRYKTPKAYTNDDVVRRKADWDVGITLDMVNLVDRVDLMILGTADGDLTEAVKWVQARGVKVLVVASGISRELKKQADEFVEIYEDMLEEPKESKTIEIGAETVVKVEGQVEDENTLSE